MLCHGRATVLEDVPAARGAATIRRRAGGRRRRAAAVRLAAPPRRRRDRGARLDRAATSTAPPARDDRAVPPGTSTARFVLDPWPFAARAVVVGCEGRLLAGSFSGDAELRSALDAAPWVPLRWALSPG